MLLVVAVVILAVHSGIGHKEPFHLPGDRAVDRARRGRARSDGELRPALAIGRGVSVTAAATSAALAVAWWGVASFQVWNGATLGADRQRMHDRLVAASFVEHGPAPCGIGLYGLHGEDWGGYGGYTHLH